MAQIKLVVGLGNPGRKYERTRHNFGFMVLDYLAGELKQKFKSGRGQWAQAKLSIDNYELWAIKPKTYMNRSGLAVRMFTDYYKILPEEVLVICDDINLPAGQIRIRANGSAGGHKGLADIITVLGSSDFPRLRLGVGMPSEGEPSEIYVLKPFADNEKKIVEDTIKNAVSAIDSILKDSLETAQNRFN